MAGLKKCTNPECKLDNDLDARYCIYCGQEFSKRKCLKCGFLNDPVILDVCSKPDCRHSLNINICPNPECNRENDPDAFFCIYCGSPFPAAERKRVYKSIRRKTPFFLGIIIIGILVLITLPNIGGKNQSTAILTIDVEDPSNKPLEGVAFSVIGGKTIDYTNSYGKLEIKLTKDIMPGDTLYFELTKDHYRSVYDYLTVQGGSNSHKRYAMPRVQYVIKFILQDDAKNPLEGVSIYRNNADTYQKSDLNGRFEDSFDDLDAPIKYEFKKPCYQSVSWMANKTSVPEIAYSKQIVRSFELKKMFFTIQCLDTTNLYLDNLEGIKVVSLLDNTVRYTDRFGKCPPLPLCNASGLVKLQLSKDPFFPVQSSGELKVQPNQMVRIILSPLEGSLTLKILCPDGSPFKQAIVTMEGKGYFDQQVTRPSGIVNFQSPHLRRDEQYKITVKKGPQQETSVIYFTEWNMEKELTVHFCGD